MSWNAETNKLKYLLSTSIKSNKKMRFTLQKVAKALYDIICMSEKMENCPDCLVYPKPGRLAKHNHNPGCSIREAIKVHNLYIAEATKWELETSD